MVSLVNESVIFTITILTAYIHFASIKLNKLNHIVKVLAKIHSFTSTINPNSKTICLPNYISITSYISTSIWFRLSLLIKIHCTHTKKTPVYREKKLPNREIDHNLNMIEF